MVHLIKLFFFLGISITCLNGQFSVQQIGIEYGDRHNSAYRTLFREIEDELVVIFKDDLDLRILTFEKENSTYSFYNEYLIEDLYEYSFGGVGTGGGFDYSKERNTFLWTTYVSNLVDSLNKSNEWEISLDQNSNPSHILVTNELEPYDRTGHVSKYTKSGNECLISSPNLRHSVTSVRYSGGVRKFKNEQGSWDLQQTLRDYHELPRFGSSLDVSEDGKIMVVGGSGVPDWDDRVWVYQLENGNYELTQKIESEEMNMRKINDTQVFLSNDGQILNIIRDSYKIYRYELNSDGIYKLIHNQQVVNDQTILDNAYCNGDGSILVVGAETVSAPGKKTDTVYINYCNWTGDSFEVINVVEEEATSGENNRMFVTSINNAGDQFICFKERVGNNDLDSIYIFTNTISNTHQQDKIDVTIFPNPVNNELSVKGAANHYEIYDTNGKLVHQGELIGSNSSIKVNALSQGIYFIVLHVKGNTIRKKFVKI